MNPALVISCEYTYHILATVHKAHNLVEQPFMGQHVSETEKIVQIRQFWRNFCVTKLAKVSVN